MCCNLVLQSGVCKPDYYASSSGCHACNGSWGNSSVGITFLVLLLLLGSFLLVAIKNRRDLFARLMRLSQPVSRQAPTALHLSRGPPTAHSPQPTQMRPVLSLVARQPPPSFPLTNEGRNSIRVEHQNPMLALADTPGLFETSAIPIGSPELGPEVQNEDPSCSESESIQKVSSEAQSFQLFMMVSKLLVAFCQVGRSGYRHRSSPSLIPGRGGMLLIFSWLPT